MKVLFDTDSKTTAFIDDAGATVVHPTNETVTIPAGPNFTSEIGQAFGHTPTPDDPNAWWNDPNRNGANATPSVREQYGPGEHDIIADASRKVPELNGMGGFLFRIKAAKDGKLRLQLAGKPSGALTGAVAIAMPGEAGNQVADGNLDSFDYTTKPVKAGDVVTLSLRKDGGDDKTEFPIWSL